MQVIRLQLSLPADPKKIFAKNSKKAYDPAHAWTSGEFCVKPSFWGLLFLFFPLASTLFGGFYDLCKFNEIFSQPTPEWMKEQVIRDFKPFYKDGFTLEGVSEIYSRSANQCHYYDVGGHNMLRFRTIKGKVFVYSRFRAHDGHSQEYGRTLAQLSELNLLPDVDFVICGWDTVHVPLAQRCFFWLSPEDSKSERGPAPLFAKDKADEYLGTGVVLIPDPASLEKVSDLINELNMTSASIPWGKKLNIAMWRGSPSDLQLHVPEGADKRGVYSKEFIQKLYSSRPRYRLCELSLKHPDLINAGFWSFNDPHIEGFEEFLKPMMKGWIAPNDHVSYKYLPCLDGWASTFPGYLWRLSTNCVVLKQETECIQWFYHALKPYVHYIPIRRDLSDILEKLEWAKSHDNECELISDNARTFVHANLTGEHQLFYFYLILKEYEKLQRFDVKDLELETENDPNWSRIH